VLLLARKKKPENFSLSLSLSLSLSPSHLSEIAFITRSAPASLHGVVPQTITWYCPILDLVLDGLGKRRRKIEPESEPSLLRFFFFFSTSEDVEEGEKLLLLLLSLSLFFSSYRLNIV
jgi:hypothetical protein